MAPRIMLDTLSDLALTAKQASSIKGVKEGNMDLEGANANEKSFKSIIISC